MLKFDDSVRLNMQTEIDGGIPCFTECSSYKQLFIAAELMSDQDINTQLEIMIHAIAGNAELPGPIVSDMQRRHYSQSPMKIIGADILAYLTDDLSKEYDRLKAKSNQPDPDTDMEKLDTDNDLAQSHNKAIGE